MTMIVCQECQQNISDTAKMCPHCGAKVPHAIVWPWLLAIPVVLLALFLAYGATVSSTPEGRARSVDRDAISSCWQQQKDPSLDPATQRFVAKTCEKMETDFRAQYGVDP